MLACSQNKERFRMRTLRVVEPMTASPPSLQEIAASVSFSPTHKSAEEKLANLRQRRDELQADALQAATGVREERAGARPERADALAAQVREVESEIVATRRTVSLLRRERANQIAKAIEAVCRSAAERALEAADTLNDATALLVEASEIQRRSGNPDAPHLNYPVMTSIVTHARKVLGN
jgi:hypothetical protein